MTTQALLKFEGVDGSTTFTDETANQTWTAGGTGTVAEIDTDKFVAGSSSLLVDAGQYINATLLNPLTADFTIEGWFYVDSTGPTGTLVLLDAQQTGSYYFQITYVTTTDTINMYSPWGSVTISTGTNRPDSWKKDAWLHIAIIRKADGSLTGAINGVPGETILASSAFTNANVEEIYIGNHLTSNADFAGWIDGIRIIDENIYGRTYVGLPETDPGLIYTVLDPDIEVKDFLMNPYDETYQLNPGFVGLGSDNITILQPFYDPDDLSGACQGSGIQIWG